MAQLVKGLLGLLGKHKDQSSDPQHPRRKWVGIVAHSYNPSSSQSSGFSEQAYHIQDGTMVKSTCCSCRTWGWFPAPTWWFIRSFLPGKPKEESRGGMVSEHWSRAAEVTQQLRAFAAFVEGLGLEREGIR